MRTRLATVLALGVCVAWSRADAQATRPPRARRQPAAPAPRVDSLAALPAESLATLTLFVRDSLTGQPVWRISAAYLARGRMRVARSHDVGMVRLTRLPPGALTIAVSCDSVASPQSDVWLANIRLRERAGSDSAVALAVDASRCDYRPMYSVEATFIGRFTSASDTSRLEACGLPDDGAILVRFDSTVGRLRWPASSDPYRDVVYLRGYGTLVGPALFGADGRSAYELRVHRVDVIRTLLPTDCDGQFASP